MRLGALEIGIVIVMALIIFGVARMKRLSQNAAQENEPPARVRKRKTKVETKQTRYPRLQILGGIFILVGILLLLTNIRMAAWVGEAPIWAIAIAAVGALVLLIARRK